jgi:hypothetical protein
VARPQPEPKGPARPPELGVCTPDYAFGSWRNVFIVLWRGDTTIQAVRQLARECERFRELFPDGMFLFTIILPDATPPPGPVRGALAAFLKSADYIRASAVVMEGNSIRAALVRGVVTGLTMLARQPFPHRVCSLEDAGLLFEKANPSKTRGFDRVAFMTAVAELRRLVEGAPGE